MTNLKVGDQTRNDFLDIATVLKRFDKLPTSVPLPLLQRVSIKIYINKKNK